MPKLIFRLESFRMQTYLLIGLLLVLSFITSLLAGTCSLANAQASAINTTVNFSTPLTPAPLSMSGFLHGLDSPLPGSLIQPLKPAWWRIEPGNMDIYKQARSYGSNAILVLSDSYGYPLNNWNGNGAPWENNWQKWEAHVRTIARQYKNLPVYWDVWNEPDVASWNKTLFWSGTQAQFFEAYKRAYTVLRAELGKGAIIGGPSYANYEPANITQFLEYCNANGLQVNFLSWHELGDADLDIPSVATHTAYMRRLKNSYPNLRTDKILINESVGQAAQYFPGDILAYLYYLEKGGAHGSNKGCWDAADGSQNCYNGSLDGIINPATMTPRAAWWTYKTYSDGILSRVQATTQNSNIAIMASRAPAQVLLGYYKKTGGSSLNVNITLQNLSSAGIVKNTVQASIFKIPNTGEKPLLQPILVSKKRIPISKNTAVVNVIDIKLHEQYLITLAP